MGGGVDTFDELALEVADLARRVEAAQAAAQDAGCPPFERTGCTDRDEREDDLRVLRNALALLQFGVPKHVPYTRRRVLPHPPRGWSIPYPRRPTDAV